MVNSISSLTHLYEVIDLYVTLSLKSRRNEMIQVLKQVMCFIATFISAKCSNNGSHITSNLLPNSHIYIATNFLLLRYQCIFLMVQISGRDSTEKRKSVFNHRKPYIHSMRHKNYCIVVPSTTSNLSVTYHSMETQNKRE